MVLYVLNFASVVRIQYGPNTVIWGTLKAEIACQQVERPLLPYGDRKADSQPSPQPLLHDTEPERGSRSGPWRVSSEAGWTQDIGAEEAIIFPSYARLGALKNARKEASSRIEPTPERVIIECQREFTQTLATRFACD